MDNLISKNAVLNLPRSIDRTLYGEVIDEWVNIKDIMDLPSIGEKIKADIESEMKLDYLSGISPYKRCLDIIDRYIG